MCARARVRACVRTCLRRVPQPMPALPPGWRSAQDMSGRTYYYHTVRAIACCRARACASVSVWVLKSELIDSVVCHTTLCAHTRAPRISVCTRVGFRIEGLGFRHRGKAPSATPSYCLSPPCMRFMAGDQEVGVVVSRYKFSIFFLYCDFI